MNEPKSIINIKSGEYERYNTGIIELNRVLGGGIVKGSLTLISGAPGIGKSHFYFKLQVILLENMEKCYMYLERNQKNK